MSAQSFIDAYRAGEPVAAFNPEGRLVGIPCGFVQFDDGLAWATDAVVASDWTGSNPYRHLYGEVASAGTSLSCDGWRFSPGPLSDTRFRDAWRSLDPDQIDWQSVHRRVEERLRQDRAMREEH